MPTSPQILHSPWRLAYFSAAHFSDRRRRRPGRGQIRCAAWIHGFFRPCPREGKLGQGTSLPGPRAAHSLAFLSHQPILCLREQVLSQRWLVLGRTGSKTRGWLLPQQGNPCLEYGTLQFRQSLELSFPSGKRKEAEPHKGSGVSKAH